MLATHLTSTFKRHLPCEACGSSDAKALYEREDGTTYTKCFSCQDYQGGALPVAPAIPKAGGNLLDWQPCGLQKRRLNADTCRKYSYGVCELPSGEVVQVANFHDPVSGEVVAQKVRTAAKTFSVRGNLKKAGLFGQHLWRTGGKRIVITEGEIDAMSCAQAMGLTWAVVSVPNGAQSAKSAIAAQLEWLQSYNEVVICFDSDKPGKDAAVECAQLFKPGTVKIATLPLKDASDMLIAGRAKELVNCLWEAREYAPSGIVQGDSLWEAVIHEDPFDKVDYPWTELNKVLGGLRTHEIVTFAAGSGVGKSAVVREIAHWLLVNGERVGYLGLEESVKRSCQGLLGIALNRPLYRDPTSATVEEMREAFDEVISDRAVFLDAWGSVEEDRLISRIRYMIHACNCRWICLDHISIVVSGLDQRAVDERRALDGLMTKLRSLCQETGTGMLLVSHLRRPEGRGHEEGGATHLSQLRGSHSIAQLSDAVIGLERDQQGDDPNLTTLRVLKNRWSGLTGLAGSLRYEESTGRLTEAEITHEETPF